MTSRDRIYTAACRLPRSLERTLILEACVTDERSDLLRARRAIDAYDCATVGTWPGSLDTHLVNFCVNPAVHG